MKTFTLLCLLTVPALASDNCYIHERGSESWFACKEFAAENDAFWREHRADQRELAAENANASAMDTQTEALRIQLEAAMREQSIHDQEGR